MALVAARVPLFQAPSGPIAPARHRQSCSPPANTPPSPRCMQMLVYENYSKFIAATDTIRAMSASMEGMDGRMAALRDLIGAMLRVALCWCVLPCAALFPVFAQEDGTTASLGVCAAPLLCGPPPPDCTSVPHPPQLCPTHPQPTLGQTAWWLPATPSMASCSSGRRKWRNWTACAACWRACRVCLTCPASCAPPSTGVPLRWPPTATLTQHRCSRSMGTRRVEGNCFPSWMLVSEWMEVGRGVEGLVRGLHCRDGAEACLLPTLPP